MASAIEGPGYAPGEFDPNLVWEGDAATGRWITIDEWHRIHDPAPPPTDSGNIDDPGFPGGGVIEGGGGPTAGDKWNGGSPPSIPLQAGHGWEWNGNDWVQVPGKGIGFTGGAAPTPTPRPPSGGGGYAGGGGFQEWDPGEAPAFNAPRWQAPPEFKYNRQFTAPNSAELTADPSFQFRLDQGRKAMEQSAAGKGVLRTGGTLKDLVNYGQNLATNEYSNVYNRKFNEYKFDYDKEADIYAKNYGLSRDVFDRNYKASYDEYSPKLRGWEVKSNANWQKYMFDRNKEQQDLGNW
jgi:hypothetical protein